jgi:hypothetical protein
VTEKRIKLPLPDGTFVEGVDVEIVEAIERWSELTLEDGTLLKVKSVVVQTIRTDNYDPDGNPIYVIRGAPLMAIGSVPDDLRKKR